jgi:cytochrome P450
LTKLDLTRIIENTDLHKDGEGAGFRGVFYLDVYPAAQPMIFIIDPTVTSQVHNVARHPLSNNFLRGLVGTKSVFSTNGKEWQAQRSWFAPAFSMSHLTTLVPGMVEETLVFREKLTKYAVSGETFSMLELAIRLTIDVISRSGFDMKLKTQTEDGPIYDAFQGAISWTAGLVANTFHKALSPYMMDYYTRRLDKLLGQYVKERYADGMDDKATKSILDLALRGYRKENGKIGKSVTKLDNEFLKIAVDK